MSRYDYADTKIVSIRPLSRTPSGIRKLVEEKSEGLSLDVATLLERLSGCGPRVLIHSSREERIIAAVEDCRRLGVPHAVIDAEEVTRGSRVEKVKSVLVGRDSVSFYGYAGEILSVSRKENVLLVFASKNQKRLASKRRNSLLLRKDPCIPFDDVYRLFVSDGAYADICIPGENVILRIDTRKFDYSCLGGKKTSSITRNSDLLLREILSCFRVTMVDYSFGEGFFPFTESAEDLEGERLEEGLTKYTRFVKKTVELGVFGEPDELASELPGEIDEKRGSLVFLGPLDALASTDTESGHEVAGASESGIEGALPPPPVAPVRKTGGGLRIFLNIRVLLGGVVDRWKGILVPGWFFYSAGGLSLLGFLFFLLTSSMQALLAGLASGAVFSFGASFSFLNLKRKVENLPTVKARSLPMGLVELKGRARCKYFLKAPFSGIDCIYYRYFVLETVRYGRRARARVREWGESGRVPFYLEDETGRVLVNPEGAAMEGGRTQVFHGGRHVSVTPGGMPLGSNAEVFETVFQEGGFVYVLGFARPLVSSAEEKRKKVAERLKELKRSTDEMRKYDIDGDGVVDSYEWDRAREKVELEVMMEDILPQEDRIVVGSPPGSGVFFISDDREKSVTTWLGVRALLLFVMSLVCAAASVAVAFRIFG